MDDLDGILLRGVKLRQGDGVCFEGHGSLPWAIRKLTRSRGESKTEVNHFGIITGSICDLVPREAFNEPLDPHRDIPIHEALVCEALWHHVEQPLLANHAGQRITIYRPQLDDGGALLEWQVRAIVEHQRSYIGDRYPAWKLPIHAVDRILFNNRVVMRRLLFTRRDVCSATGAKSYARGRVWIIGKNVQPITPKAVQPDDIWDAWHEYDVPHWRRIVEQVVVPGRRK